MKVNDQTLQVIDKVAKRLAPKFIFGYYEVEDIEQQARLIALEALDVYDGIRPLENYLMVHVKNRLCNFKRDHFMRQYGPCEKCGYFNKVCDKYDQSEDCDIYNKWQANNVIKLNLLYPIEMSCVDDHNEDNMCDNGTIEGYVQNEELRVLLDEYIPVQYRHAYLKILYGCKVGINHKKIVFQIIKEIVAKYYGADRAT